MTFKLLERRKMWSNRFPGFPKLGQFSAYTKFSFRRWKQYFFLFRPPTHLPTKAFFLFIYTTERKRRWNTERTKFVGTRAKDGLWIRGVKLYFFIFNVWKVSRHRLRLSISYFNRPIGEREVQYIYIVMVRWKGRIPGFFAVVWFGSASARC